MIPQMLRKHDTAWGWLKRKHKNTGYETSSSPQPPRASWLLPVGDEPPRLHHLLKMLGNIVIPQQAMVALQTLASR